MLIAHQNNSSVVDQNQIITSAKAQQRTKPRRRRPKRPQYRDLVSDPIVPTIYRWFEVILTGGQVIILCSVKHPYALESYYKVPTGYLTPGMKRLRSRVRQAGEDYLTLELMWCAFTNLSRVRYPYESKSSLIDRVREVYADEIAACTTILTVKTDKGDWPILAMLVGAPVVGGKLKFELSYRGHRHQGNGHCVSHEYTGVVKYSPVAQIVTIREILADEASSRGLKV
jgi:hypothetical protein